MTLTAQSKEASVVQITAWLYSMTYLERKREREDLCESQHVVVITGKTVCCERSRSLSNGMLKYQYNYCTTSILLLPLSLCWEY